MQSRSDFMPIVTKDLSLVTFINFIDQMKFSLIYALYVD